MMNILTVPGLAVFITCVPSLIHGNVSKGIHLIRTVSTVECISGSDIKLQFISETDTTTMQTIAECETSLRSCFLTDQSLGEYYSVYYTGSGAMLSVVTDDEHTSGTYRCCETYNSSNCINLESKLLVKNETKCIANEETNDQTGIIPERLSTCSPAEALIICQIVFTTCLITMLIIYMKQKKVFSSKVCFQPLRRTEERRMLQEQGKDLGTTETLNVANADITQAADEEPTSMLHEDEKEKVTLLDYLPATKETYMKQVALPTSPVHAAAMKEDSHARGDVPILQRFIDDQRRLLRRYEDMLDDDFVHNTEKLETKTGVGTGMKINIWPLDLKEM